MHNGVFVSFHLDWEKKPNF